MSNFLHWLTLNEMRKSDFAVRVVHERILVQYIDCAPPKLSVLE